MYNINDKSSAIRAIQKYLSKIYGDTLNVNENGIFDDKTSFALNRFQKENELEIKNSVDFAAFSAIINAYNEASLISDVKRQNPHIKFPLTRGMQNIEIYKINSILGDILRHYSLSDSPPLTNYYSEQTENAVKKVSGIFNMDEQAEIDEILYSKIEKELKAINTIINDGNEYFPD